MFCSQQQMGSVAMAEDSHSDGYLICSTRAATLKRPNKSWYKFKHVAYSKPASQPWNMLHIAPCSFSGSLLPWTSRVLVALCLCQSPSAFRAIRCDELSKKCADLATRFGSPPTLWQGEPVLSLVWLQNSLHFMIAIYRDCHDWLHRFNASLVFLLQVPVCLGYRAAKGRSSATPAISGCRPSRRVDARLWDLWRGKVVDRNTSQIGKSGIFLKGCGLYLKTSQQEDPPWWWPGNFERTCQMRVDWGGFTVPWSHFFCWPKLRKLGEHVVLGMLMALSALTFYAWHSHKGLFGAASLRSPSRVRCLDCQEVFIVRGSSREVGGSRKFGRNRKCGGMTQTAGWLRAYWFSPLFWNYQLIHFFLIPNASKCMEAGARLSVHAVCLMSRLPRQVLFAKALADHLGVRPKWCNWNYVGLLWKMKNRTIMKQWNVCLFVCLFVFFLRWK